MKRMKYPHLTICYAYMGDEQYEDFDWKMFEEVHKDTLAIGFKELCRKLNQVGRKDEADRLVGELESYVNDELYGEEWNDMGIDDEFYYLKIVLPIWNLGYVKRSFKTLARECQMIDDMNEDLWEDTI